jgi:hypothetical protein
MEDRLSLLEENEPCLQDDLDAGRKTSSVVSRQLHQAVGITANGQLITARTQVKINDSSMMLLAASLAF